MEIAIPDLVFILWLTLLTGFGLATFISAWMTRDDCLVYLKASDDMVQPVRSRVLVDQRSYLGSDFLINRSETKGVIYRSPSLLKDSPLQKNASFQTGSARTPNS